ncbi:MAG: MFS transporter [Planctomycetes bacterium]|jgi:MFS family permease|nr:MFS transporter [Planctomycetota bacterium]
MSERRTGLRLLLVTTCYQGFTLSDGALRMLVLLHLSQQGRTPAALLLVLLPYEIAGVFTNLLGGWLGARFGLKLPLLLGLLLQTIACVLLAADPARLTLAYVMATQVASGIAKDLAKTAAKSYVRALPGPADDGRLFARVAWLTGSKNVTKGLGFFVGGALLAWAGFRGTNQALAVLLFALTVLAVVLLPNPAGKPRSQIVRLVDHGPAVRWLALARLFLFAARDAWFAIALPVFLATALQWPSPWIGTFLAAWVIGYGIVQAATPRWWPSRTAAVGVRRTRATTAALMLPLLGTAAALWGGLAAGPVLVVGLCALGAVFAVTSSLHSWLVLAIANGDDVVERVGFYYAANSAGRLLGTVLSGTLFAAWSTAEDGLLACLLAAVGLTALATLATARVRAAG